MQSQWFTVKVKLPGGHVLFVERLGENSSRLVRQFGKATAYSQLASAERAAATERAFCNPRWEVSVVRFV